MEYSLGLVEVSALGNAIIMLDDMLKAAAKTTAEKKPATRRRGRPKKTQ